MAQFESISYTLRIVYDDLKSRLSELSQNVSTYDHLMYLEHELSNETSLDKVKDYYGRILSIQERIHNEIRHIQTQLKTFYSERNASDTDQARHVWITNGAFNLKNELTETIERLTQMQRSFVQAHKSKVFDLERTIDGQTSAEVHTRIDLFRNASNRLETDIQYNAQIIDDLERLVVKDDGHGNAPYEEVAIDSHVSVPRFVPAFGSFHATTEEGAVTRESLSREQNLLLVIGTAICLGLLVTVILVAVR